MKKAKEKMNIGVAVSFGGSYKKDYKIVTVLTNGSTATVTTWADTTRGGMNFIPSPALKRTLETNGLKVTEVTKENGND